MVDDLEPIIEANALTWDFQFGTTIGQARAWWGRQDRETKRVDGYRLAYNQRDIIVLREDLPREPRAGDTFTVGGIVWTVRPRDRDCFTQCDRLGQLLRVYVTR